MPRAKGLVLSAVRFFRKSSGTTGSEAQAALPGTSKQKQIYKDLKFNYLQIIRLQMNGPLVFRSGKTVIQALIACIAVLV
jgi:hypothetical protein